MLIFCFSEWVISELTSNPINAVLLIAIVFLVYKILKPESGEKDQFYYRRRIILFIGESLLLKKILVFEAKVSLSKRLQFLKVLDYNQATTY